MLVTEMDLRGPYHSWHRSGNGTLSQEGCCWPCMCWKRGGLLLSSTLWCWSRIETPCSTAGRRALRLEREPMIPTLYPGPFAPAQLALESWVHLATNIRRSRVSYIESRKSITEHLSCSKNQLLNIRHAPPPCHFWSNFRYFVFNEAALKPYIILPYSRGISFLYEFCQNCI